MSLLGDKGVEMGWVRNGSGVVRGRRRLYVEVDRDVMGRWKRRLGGRGGMKREVVEWVVVGGGVNVFGGL